MAPPRKHPPKDAATTIEKLAADGHSIIGIAKRFGVSKQTFQRWLEENEALNEAFELGRESERQMLHALVIASAKSGKGPNVNAFFLLKARHSYREGEQQPINVDARSVTNVMVVKNFGSDEEWEKKAAEQQRKLAQS